MLSISDIVISLPLVQFTVVEFSVLMTRLAKVLADIRWCCGALTLLYCVLADLMQTA